ncbi:unnamed protein product [Meganyctiphanes norvegica]|uniref:Uncharacterized protein n=1 Tax=Meganyctiphanes norvegica TaxID=48144 RepID=A0AAV2SFF9_MEGNR
MISVALFILSWISYGYGIPCYGCNSYEATSWLYDPSCNIDGYNNASAIVESPVFFTCRINVRYDTDTGLPDNEHVTRYGYYAHNENGTCQDRGNSIECYCEGDLCNTGLCDHCVTWPTTEKTQEPTHMSTDRTDFTHLSTTRKPTQMSTDRTDFTRLSTTQEPTHMSTDRTDFTHLSTTQEPTHMSTDRTDFTHLSTTQEPTHMSTDRTDFTHFFTTEEPSHMSTDHTHFTYVTTPEPNHTTTENGNLECYSCIDCPTVTDETHVVSSSDYLSCFIAIELEIIL